MILTRGYHGDRNFCDGGNKNVKDINKEIYKIKEEFWWMFFF